MNEKSEFLTEIISKNILDFLKLPCLFTIEKKHHKIKI